MTTATTRINRNRLQTPWGVAQGTRTIGLGIRFVTTAGHGGYHVPADVIHRIPKAQRQWAAGWSGSEEWYEEDCCWAAVALAFPQFFPADAVEMAGRMIAEYVG